MNGGQSRAKAGLAAAMCIFGSIGVFARAIGWPSAQLALARAVVGAVVLGCAVLCVRPKVRPRTQKRLSWLLAFSGAALGGNWILLFEAYRTTTVATATLCYYCAPVLVLLAAPVVLHERLTPLRCGCAAVCAAGLFLTVGAGGLAGLRGALPALGAAVLYACVMLCNRRLGAVEDLSRTLAQLCVAAVLLGGYAVLTPGALGGAWTGKAVLLALLVGAIHTGLAYLLYFSAAARLPAQTTAVLSYLDPAVAVLCSALWLREPVSAAQWAGAALILGGALVCELAERRAAAKRER